MTFGDGDPTVEYPVLHCRGTLGYATTTGKRRVYAEHIDSGPCPRGGYWTIERISDDEIRVTWSRPNSTQQTKGTLER